MRRNSLLFCLTIFSVVSHAQLTIQSGAQLFIQPGATVTVQGDLTSHADILGTGTILMKGTALQTLSMNGFNIPNLQIDNTNNVTLGSDGLIGSSFQFIAGKLQLSGYNLRLTNTATLTGFDNTKYFVTNGTGKLFRNAVDATGFTFPVGADATTYNPLLLVQNGTVDDLGVRVLPNVLKNGSTGSAFIKEVVDASWDIAEGTAGGNNLDMTATWNGTDELTGFNRTRTGISLYDGVGWDLTNVQRVAATGSGPYTITRTGVTNLGPFAVGTRPVLTTLLVSPKVYLQGPYASAGMMNDGLRAAGLIPLTEPYSSLSNFTHYINGSGGGETIGSSILAASGTPANDIVDWLFAQLHDGSSGSIINTRAVLLQRDGDVVDVDGTGAITPYINFAGDIPANYYVSIRHRNHLGARTLNNVPLVRTTTTNFNFSNNLSQIFTGSVTANSPLATLESGVFGLWAGNANSDLFSRRSGSATINDYSLLLNYLGPSLSIPSVYQRADFNNDGTVRRSGSVLVNDYSKLLNLLGPLLSVSQPAF